MAKNGVKRQKAYERKMCEHAHANRINGPDGTFRATSSSMSSIERMHLAGASQRNTPNLPFEDRVKAGYHRDIAANVVVEHGNWNLIH